MIVPVDAGVVFRMETTKYTHILKHLIININSPLQNLNYLRQWMSKYTYVPWNPEGEFLWCPNAFRSVNSAFIWLRLVWLILFIQVFPSIEVIRVVSVAGEDSSLQLYDAVSMGEQVLSGLAFSSLVQWVKPIFPRLTGCIVIGLANCLKPDCRYTYHLLCRLKTSQHLAILSIYVLIMILTIDTNCLPKQHNWLVFIKDMRSVLCEVWI